MILATVLPGIATCVSAASLSDGGITASSYEEHLKNVPMTPEKAMIEKAQRAVPADLDKRVEEERKKLMDGIFSGAKDVLEYNKNSLEREKALSEGPKERLALGEGERIYIFISSSIPMHTLRNYARGLDLIGTQGMVMVMRGFVEGMKKAGPTLGFARKVLMKDENCDGRNCDPYRASVIIDPLLFGKYGIDTVPAVVYAAKGGESYVLYGDVSLEGALEVINREANSSNLDCLLRRLRRGLGYACSGK